MNPFLWDTFSPVEVNDKIRYWVDLWESLIDNMSDMFLGLAFMNPHLLVRHIIDEIVFNRFQNPDNRAFFQTQLDLIVKLDPVTKKMFASDFALIRREFGHLRFVYLLKLCRSVDQAYSQSTYLDELYAALRAVFTSPTWDKTDAVVIRTISQFMIVEFNLRGYSLTTIKSFPANIFDKSTGFVFSRLFPSRIKVEDYLKDGQLDNSAYRSAVQSEVESVSIAARLDAFKRYFRPETKTAYMVYQLEGIKGDDLDLTIGNVNIYSPKKKRYIKSIPEGESASLREDELFGLSENACSPNAAVKIQEIDTPASETEAVFLIEKAFDLIRTFVNAEFPFKVMSHHYIRVSPDGEYWGSGSRAVKNDPAYKRFHSIDLNELAKFAFPPGLLASAERHLFGNDPDSDGRRIAHSLHWFRKAEEAEIPEDRLLGYWIVLENLVGGERSTGQNLLLPPKDSETKFSLIRELIPAVEACLYLSQAAGNLYQFLVSLMTTSTNGRPHLTLPDEIASKSLLIAPFNSSINLITFVSNLDEVADCIERKVVKDFVLYVKQILTDASTAKEDISQRFQYTRDDLLMIYRFRNRIVHNAHFDNAILPHYVHKARKYAGNALRLVLNDVCGSREQNIEKSLMRYYVSLTRIRERLEKGLSVDFLNYEF